MNQPQKLKISAVIGESELKTRYSNFSAIHSTSEEFILDFFHVFSPSQSAVLQSRVSLSPRTAKGFLKALKESLEKYESKNGEIKPTGDPQPQVGFRPPQT
jgi:hypothetical protein